MLYFRNLIFDGKRMNTFSLSDASNNYLSRISVIGVFLVLVFGMTVFPIFDNQEAINALAAMNLLNEGGWIAPEGIGYPPLNIWILALSQKFFGINEFALRFPAAIFMWMTFLTLFFHVNRFDRQLGLATLVVFASNIAVGIIGNVGLHYSPLIFFMTTMVVGVQRYLIYEQPGWLVLIGFMLSLALLTEGPAVLIYVILLFVLLILFFPKGKWLLKPRVWLTLIISTLPLIYWMYLAEKASPGYVMQFIEENGYIWTFTNSLSLPFFSHWEMLVLIFAFLPFVVFIPRALVRTITVSMRKGAPKQFFAIWAISAWLPYIILGGKVVWLSMLSFPAFSVIIGSLVLDWSRQVKKFPRLFAPLVQAAILAVALIIAVSTSMYIMKPGSWYYIFIPGIMLVIGGVLIIWRMEKINARDKFRRWLLYGLVGSLTFWIAAPHAFRHHWGVVKYMTKSMKKYDMVYVSRVELERHPSLEVYLHKYMKDRFMVLETFEAPMPPSDMKAAYIFPLDVKHSSIVFAGKISGGIGEVAYGIKEL